MTSECFNQTALQIYHTTHITVQWFCLTHTLLYCHKYVLANQSYNPSQAEYNQDYTDCITATTVIKITISLGNVLEWRLQKSAVKETQLADALEQYWNKNSVHKNGHNF